MFLSAVSVLVVAQSSSEIPEGLMNNPVVTNDMHVEWFTELTAKELKISTALSF